jgi:hypothetical protein
MSLHYTTPVPNDFFSIIPTLSDSELRVLLLTIRQTYGWICTKTKRRKQRDKMTYSFIIKRTGLYRSCLSTTIQSLINKKVLKVTNYSGHVLDTPQKRKGIRFLFYEYVSLTPVCNNDTASLNNETRPIRVFKHNKRNTNQKKLIQNKKSFAEIGDEVLAQIRNRMDENKINDS